ncbi:MAG: hypothetical protein QOE93_655 [Actinomycetota bacterium]|jgi:hypothetical protein|nr:hypothetical protein [Actinomycetota bacterium]
MRRPFSSVLAVLIVPLVLLSGCGSDPKAPDTTAPPGFTVFKDDKAGFAVAIPADWQKVPLTDDLTDFNKTANRLRLENPNLGTAMVLARIVAQAGGRLFAVDHDGTSSVNLTVDKAREKSIDEVVATIKPALTGAGATDLTDEAIILPAGPAARLRFKLPVQTDEGPVVVDEVQYYLLKDGSLSILTVVASDLGLATTIAESLRIR